MTETISAMGAPSEKAEGKATTVTATSDIRFDKHGVTVRLVEIILEMPEQNQRDMLKALESELAEKQDDFDDKVPLPKNMREHPRKTSLIAVDCATNDTGFTNFIHDISNGGVFIETTAPFYVGQKLSLNFSLPKIDHPISVGGEVVRIDSTGIGVRFIEGDVQKIDIS
ncbi:MAG: PilZ domain-containing protein [Desulfobacterales bacterium]|nr:MAG: PilZ domain-containing protein [Desulfobacterales bacterium]